MRAVLLNAPACVLRGPAAAVCGLLLLASAAPASAQVQERRMREILEPDLSRASEFRDRKADLGRLFRPREGLQRSFDGAKPARTRTFPFSRRAAVADRTFGGARTARDAEAVFGTETGRVIPRVNDRVPARRIEPATAREAGRGAAPAREFPFIRAAEPRGTRQEALDQQNGPRPALTIDEVRELLNKDR